MSLSLWHVETALKGRTDFNSSQEGINLVLGHAQLRLNL